jgi:hypothetical protein
MNLFEIFSEVRAKDPVGYSELSNRRDLLKKFADRTGRIALTALPLALGSLFQKAYAGGGPSPSTVLGILNYALTLEYLEEQFYNTGLQCQNLFPTTIETNAFTTIHKHEVAHVAFLQNAIVSLGGTAVASPKFDFTGGSGSGKGPFRDVFSNYETFLTLAQVFEDTGVRAYEGQLDALLQGGPLLSAALGIHSTEARHASAVRQFRYDNGFATIKPWITLKDPGISAGFESVYDGEQNTVQAGLQIIDIGGNNLNNEAASEAFDEPLSSDSVQAILQPFLAQ